MPGQTNHAKDSMNRAAAADRQVDGSMGGLIEGTVIRATPGTNDLLVSVPGHAEVRCKYAPAMLVREFGIRSTVLPPEGTPVLLYRSGGEASIDVVLCCLPPVLSNIGGSGSRMTGALKSFVQMVGEEPGASYFNLDAWRAVFSDKANKSSFSANAGRAFDVIPGEKYDITDAGAFQALFNFMSGMGASQRAKLECFVFDDMVRLTTGQWQHFHSLGETHIFNDEGHASMEMAGSWSTPENYGVEKYGNLLSIDKDSENAAHSKIQYAADQLRAMKCRYQMYIGALGDFANLFISDPRDGKTEVPSATSNHRGLLRMTVGADGSIDMRSASGMTFERTDAVPVPKRMRQPWDPAGDAISSSQTSTEKDLFRPKKPLELPKGHENGRNVLRADIDAYRDAQAYQRFDELKKDFHVPQAKDVPALRNDYDPLGSTSDLSGHDGKRCGWSFDPDGSFHLWGGNGCEIFARDGMIILGAPKGVMIQTGGELVALSRDTVLKSSNSTDISATNGDVRVAAKGNMQLYSADKGILLETAAKSLGHGFQAGAKGEAVSSSGITLKAPNSTVLLTGKQVLLQAAQELVLYAKSSTVALIAKTVTSLSELFLACSKDGKAGVALASGGAATVYGDSARLAGKSGVAVLNGDKSWQPYRELPGQSNVAANLQVSAGAKYGELHSDDAWMGAYNESGRAAIMFTYRSPQEYGTSGLKLYETVWQHLARTAKAYGEIDKWKEQEVNGTFPWPGLGERNQCLQMLSGFVNVDPATGKTLNRDDVRSRAAVGTFAPKSMDEYIVIKK